MNGSEVVSGFERFVFAITRLVAALIAFLAVAGIAVCILFLIGKFDKSTTVTYQEVRAALGSSSSSNEHRPEPEPGESAAPSYPLPANLEPYLSGDNRRVLDGWMKNLDTEKQRTEFLSELSAVVAATERDGLDSGAVNDAINKYQELKFQKVSTSQFEKYQSLATKAAVGAVLFGLVFLLVILALVLVLLAIERHGRHVSKQLGALHEGAGKIEVNTRATALSLRPKQAPAAPTAR